jgi:carboxyl-terminal processing protease
MSGGPAQTELRTVAPFIEHTNTAELTKVVGALGKLDIDWSLPKNSAATGPAKDEFGVTVRTNQPNDTVTAGDPLTLTVTVKNNGTVPVYRLRATTESDNPYFDEKELAFGKIAPGEEASATTPLSWCEIEGKKVGSTQRAPDGAKRVCKIPMDALSRSDGVKVHFDAAGGHTPGTVEVRPTIIARERPLFQYTYQIADDIKGNGDGFLQRGEQATIYLTVKNIGPGVARDTQANLANRSGDGVLLRHGRFDVSNMKPGDVRHVAFTFDVEQQLQDDEVVLSLSVGDRDLREFASEKIKIPVVKPVDVSAAEGVVATTKDAELFGDALGKRAAFGRVSSGVTFRQIGRRGDYAKVMLSQGRFAFVQAAALKDATQPGGEIAFTPIYSHAPPMLEVKAAAMATRSDKVKITVEASDSERLLDMYMFVGSRKLYYQSNRAGADPRRASFTYDAPLQPGVNIITVIARETPDTTTRRVVVVRRDGADGSTLKTPKHVDDDFLFNTANP